MSFQKLCLSMIVGIVCLGVVASVLVFGLVTLSSMPHNPLTVPRQPIVAVFHFSSPYCGPCQEQRPHYEALRGKHKRCDFHDYNTELNADRPTVDQFHVSRIPAYVVTIDGKEVYRGMSVSELGDYLNRVEDWLDNKSEVDMRSQYEKDHHLRAGEQPANAI